MVNSKLTIGIKGHITMKTVDSSDNEDIIFENSNNITTDALEIVTRCLTQQDFNKSVDRIKIIGDFGEQESTVNFVQYNPDNSITFRAVFPESTFSGMVTGLELICSALDKKLAIKENLAIFKENSNLLLQVDWKIIITSN